ncbi:hypothetical protein HMPREF1146_2304 [Prevotella sp. MSX73]|nr:hypothetical protein HMPREF1146_2304 [Prevotella sp. MSX73]
MLNYFPTFGFSACDIRNGQPTWTQISDFGDISKTLIISRLNFTDTY